MILFSKLYNNIITAKQHSCNPEMAKKQIFCCKYLQKSNIGVILKALKLQSGPMFVIYGLDT